MNVLRHQVPRLEAIARYVLSGLLSALVYAAVSLIAHRIAGLALGVSGVIGYLTSMPCAYMLHRKLSFSSSQHLATEVPKFVLQSTASIFLSGFLPWAFVTMGTNLAVALFTTSIVVPILNYVLLSSWVFKKK